MGLLERIFGKTEKPPEPEKKEMKELDSEGLERIVSSMEEKELKAVGERGVMITEKLRNAVSAFNSDLSALSNAQLTEERKQNDLHAYAIVSGSREKVVGQLSHEIGTMKIPERADEKALAELNASLARFSGVIARNAKNIFYISTMFSEQVKNLKETLKIFDDIQKETLSVLNSDGFRLFKQIREKTAELKGLRELEKNLAGRQEEINGLVRSGAESRAEAENEIEKCRKSAEYGEYERSLSRSSEIKSEIEREEMSIRASLSPLVKPLRSLNRLELNKQKRRLIEDYLENPAEAVLREGGIAKLNGILSELSKSISEGKVKVQSESNVKASIDEIAKSDALSAPAARREKLRAELAELSGRNFAVLKRIEDAEGRLRQNDREKLERELSKVREKAAKTHESVDEIKKQIEALLLKAGHEVRII